ncbi:tRNAse Z TRZ4, mitochondrial isoform X2 [Rhodamnia argentea]|uniref:ribonuclease Z n=1 Tax=Rhodamnia argentea TaxID=178133 RepID=A0A8B8NV37_9MYRT|nr:tRNAse Z TRZ4, mitochondrial isoform X2 [Rhodamnia argentea]
MPCMISNLRLLFSSSATATPFLSPLKLKLTRPSLPLAPLSSTLSRPLFTVFSAVERGRRRLRHSPDFARGGNRRTFRDDRGRDKEALMEESGFNRKRAEGRDRSDGPRKDLQLKKRPKANPVSTISYVQILGTGMDTQDTSPSVLLFFDHQRFIFNAGEGLQRFCTEHKIKLSKIDHIFLSRVCSETSGGLPGLLLTLAGIGDEGMSVSVKLALQYQCSFQLSVFTMVHTKSFGPAPSSDAAAIPDLNHFADPIILVDDDVVKISAVLLWPEESGQNNGVHSAMSPGDMSVVYVCELPELKGKFHPERAKEKGLRPGPEYRELQLGKSVFSKRLNVLVHPSDVMDPSIPGPVVLLVDCPTQSHLQRLSSVGSLNDYYADFLGKETKKTVTCVIHLSPASIVSSPDYKNWMKRFGSAQHIIAGHEMKNIEIPILCSSSRIAARLNYLCPQLFPASGFWSIEQSYLSAPDTVHSSEGTSLSCQSISAENLLKFTLRPRDKIGLDRSYIPNKTAHSNIIDELHTEIPEIVEAAQCVHHLWNGTGGMGEERRFMQEEPWLSENNLPNCLENIRRDDLEIVLLGTGSSQPSKYRNVSSIYINLFAKGGLLLDCGEGTLGQMKRRFGVGGADDAVKGLRCIWISHIHADHHSGLARILAQRRDLLKGAPHEPLLVIGPRQLKRYLDAYQRLEDLDMQFLDCRNTTEASFNVFEEASELSMERSLPESPNSHNGLRKVTNGSRANAADSTLFARGSPMQSCWKRPGSPPDISVAFPVLQNMKKMLKEAGLEALVSFPVVHCPQAFGVALKASERLNSDGKLIEGWKIVYSGDTRPCPELTEASRGATVLIHEATFEDSMVDEAIARNHSTTEEAIQVGASAGVYRIILTHFSQRYPKIPVFDEAHMHKTCIAFDLMSINIADLPVLPRVLPYLKMLFRNEMIVDESDDTRDSVSLAS